jgi:signal transduction histidine kinase
MSYMCKETRPEQVTTRATSALTPVWGTAAGPGRASSREWSTELPGSVLLAAPIWVLVVVVARAPGPWSLALALLGATIELPCIAWVQRRRRARRAGGLPTLGDVVELSTRAESAENALREKEEMLHELRAMVVGITMSHQLLRTSSHEIQAATRDRLVQLQDSELARLERLVVGVPERTSDEVDLMHLVRPLADSLRLRGARVECHGAAAATGRPDDIREIVHVLLTNAARHAAGSDVRVVVFQTSTAAGIHIADDGPGVPPELASRIFDRGVRGPGSAGHGLGLHIARRLAQEMGGDLRLRPTSGGASFELTLPLSVGAVSCLAHSA